MENWTYFEIFINYLKIKHIFQVPIHSITKCNLITAFPKITPQIMQTPLPHMISSNHGPVRHLPLEMMSHWKFKEKVFKKKKSKTHWKIISQSFCCIDFYIFGGYEIAGRLWQSARDFWSSTAFENKTRRSERLWPSKYL